MGDPFGIRRQSSHPRVAVHRRARTGGVRPGTRGLWRCHARRSDVSGGDFSRGGEQMSLAFVFPGQGAQVIGMGRDLAAACPAARAVFDEVDEALGERLSALIWEGDQETLTLTQNAQPALMATSPATSSAAVTSTPSASSARLLRARGRAMQEA